MNPQVESPLSDVVAAEIVAVRRDLHAHPELSWSEQRTTDLVTARLQDAGIVVRRLLTSGLVAEVGDGAGTDRRDIRTVALRVMPTQLCSMSSYQNPRHASTAGAAPW